MLHCTKLISTYKWINSPYKTQCDRVLGHHVNGKHRYQYCNWWLKYYYKVCSIAPSMPYKLQYSVCFGCSTLHFHGYYTKKKYLYSSTNSIPVVGNLSEHVHKNSKKSNKTKDLLAYQKEPLMPYWKASLDDCRMSETLHRDLRIKSYSFRLIIIWQEVIIKYNKLILRTSLETRSFSFRF